MTRARSLFRKSVCTVWVGPAALRPAGAQESGERGEGEVDGGYGYWGRGGGHRSRMTWLVLDQVCIRFR
jgi:hypothetical protein